MVMFAGAVQSLVADEAESHYRRKEVLCCRLKLAISWVRDSQSEHLLPLHVQAPIIKRFVWPSEGKADNDSKRESRGKSSQRRKSANGFTGEARSNYHRPVVSIEWRERVHEDASEQRGTSERMWDGRMRNGSRLRGRSVCRQGLRPASTGGNRFVASLVMAAKASGLACSSSKSTS